MNPKLKGYKLNKKNSILLIILLVVVIILSVFAVKAIQKSRTEKKINEYLNQQIETYGELNIISDAVVVDGKKNTLAGIKEAVRLGANTVTLDLCFNSKDVPVICEDYDEISDDCLTLEKVFTLLNEEKYSTVKLNLRLKQISSLKIFNELIKEYEMDGRVILSGLDEKRYNMLDCSSTSAEVFFNCNPPKNTEKAVDYIFSLYDEYGISGVIINYEDITAELIEKLNQHGKAFIISGADYELNIYEILNSGANNIETSSPDKLLKIYNSWKDYAKEKIEKSIIDDLK